MEIGDKVKTLLKRAGREPIEIVGIVSKITELFGRKILTVSKGQASDFSVNAKSVKKL